MRNTFYFRHDFFVKFFLNHSDPIVITLQEALAVPQSIVASPICDTLQKEQEKESGKTLTRTTESSYAPGGDRRGQALSSP